MGPPGCLLGVFNYKGLASHGIKVTAATAAQRGLYGCSMPVAAACMMFAHPLFGPESVWKLAMHELPSLDTCNCL
eukprot:CAMPEP_0202902576 /NCGR_PEP_ID=MMETSP1392-20130828/16935_1 /ASSEMBLY_ACC=CAM_ASM_000868 /TAXON_ID=225041 /ORGANISM="Chlamydomonas chlamydogama, Strain SAG 11-48b" /LENGTH=74 /DNA_ID=CAMNT_0049589363 /DNA_START=118 /DNA_END=342 /DNA_ORIENTATION=-